MKKIIISGFPGIGKTTLYNQIGEGYTIQDSDSSKMDKSQFPQNYINLIQNSQADVILVSSHQAVRDALIENDMEFILVYPHASLKEEYLQRYRDRGSPEPFVQLMSKNWDTWIQECANQKGCHKVRLGPGEYLKKIFQEDSSEIWITQKEQGSYSDHSSWIDSVHRSFMAAFMHDKSLPTPDRTTYAEHYYTGGYTPDDWRDAYWGVATERRAINGRYLSDPEETHISTWQFEESRPQPC